MKLTFLHRLRLCWEVLTVTSGHKHSAFEKNLSVFSRGYRAGWKDKELSSDK